MVKVIVSRGGREVCDEGKEGGREGGGKVGREGGRKGGRKEGREGSLDSRSSLPAYINLRSRFGPGMRLSTSAIPVSLVATEQHMHH